MTRDSKESVLRRWSRRKQESVQETPAAEQVQPSDTEAGIGAAAPIEAEAESRPTLTDADMPPIESLNENSDYSGFMSAGVSDELRNLALRKLFKAPVFNIRDGLDEYDEDYTYFEKLGDIVTSDMKHHIEMKQQREREALAGEAEEIAGDELEPVASVEDEVEDDLDSIEPIEDEDMPAEEAEIIAKAELDPVIRQESKND
ncbi:MAG: DUF3306 domain-containing protein [Gammaproteobacteria bacterium]|nr:DUF3306 domain-containing protein [Gammaproteobacteria bacterium]